MTTQQSTSKGWESLNKNYGDKIFRASEAPKLNVEVISFPSPTLADATHFGGVPKGLITQFHGVESAGKTFVAMLMAKQVLDEDPTAEVFWADAEFSFQKKWAEHAGLDMSRLHIMQENNAGDVFDAIVGIPGKKDAAPKPGVLDQIIAGKINVKLVVLDSIASLIPPVEEGRSVSEQNIAALARFLPGAMRLTMGKVAKAKCGFICINQARDLMGAMVPTVTYPGGRSYKHSLSLAILFNATQAKSTSMLDADGVKYGHKVICTVEKTRGGPNKMKAEIWLDFRNCRFAKLGEETALLGEAYGVVQRPNNTKWVYGVNEITGKDNFFAFLEENPSIMNEILQECKLVKERGVGRVAALSEDSVKDLASESFGDD